MLGCSGRRLQAGKGQALSVIITRVPVVVAVVVRRHCNVEVAHQQHLPALDPHELMQQCMEGLHDVAWHNAGRVTGGLHHTLRNLLAYTGCMETVTQLPHA